MISFDVNILVNAYRADSPDHQACRKAVEEAISADSSFGLSELVLSGFLRIVTHPRVFDPPSPPDGAVKFCEHLRTRPNAVILSTGRRHWGIFIRLCSEASVRGNLVPDAYLAAFAIEHGLEWITLDRDFARFPGLRWRLP